MEPQPRRRAERREIAESREKILAEAEIYFAAHGLDASLHELAKRAGIGSATLFRRFPSLADLIRALYDRIASRIDVVVADLGTAPTGFVGLEQALRGILAEMFASPTLPAVMRRMAELDPSYRPGDRWVAPIVQEVERAQSEGSMRSDVTGFDVVTVALTIGSLATLTEPVRSTLAARQLVIALDGLRAPGATRLDNAEAPALDAFHRAVHRVPLS